MTKQSAEQEQMISIPMVDQSGRVVGEAHKSLPELLRVEVYRDEQDSIWTPPTAWAWAMACKQIAELENLKKGE